MKKCATKSYLLVLILLLAMVCASVTGCTKAPAPDDTGSDTTEVTDDTADDGGDGEEQTQVEYDQADPVKFQDVFFTVTKVERSPGEDFYEPKEGCEYVIISIKIENKSKKKIDYDSYRWKMENSNGQEEGTCFLYPNNETELSSGKLNPGGTVEGTLCFEEPIGDKGLKLIYYAEAYSDDDPSFKIKIN